MDIISNYYFLLKKENYLITTKETQKEVALNTVFLSLEKKNSSRSTELCLQHRKSFGYLLYTFHKYFCDMIHIHYYFSLFGK